MASVIHAAAKAVTSGNDGSLVEVTITNNNSAGGAAVQNFIVTAVYAGTTTEYIWSQTIATLAAGDSTTFDLSIDNETYSPGNLHIGIGFMNTI